MSSKHVICALSRAWIYRLVALAFLALCAASSAQASQSRLVTSRRVHGKILICLKTRAGRTELRYLKGGRRPRSARFSRGELSPRQQTRLRNFCNLRFQDQAPSSGSSSSSASSSATASSSSSSPAEDRGSTLQPLLTAGSGWTGVDTVSPGQIGDPNTPGGRDKVMARWDVVPYQEISGETKIGVVAFHQNGIARVDFSLNNGPWASTSEMSFNEVSGVWEFVARIDATGLAPGAPLEVRAIVIPANAGQPRVLAGPKENEIGNGEVSLYLFAAAASHSTKFVSIHGSDSQGDGSRANPFLTLRRALNSLLLPQDDGAEVVILDSSPSGWVIEPRNVSSVYVLNYLMNERWITIRPDDGQPVVRLISPTEHYVSTEMQRTKFKDVVFDFSSVYQIGNPANSDAIPGAMAAYWQDSVVWDGPGYEIERTVPIRGVESGVSFYTTNSRVQNLYMGFVQQSLVRGCHDEDVSGDHYTNTRLVVNSTVNHGGMCDSCIFHPDLFQYFSAPYYAGVPDDSQGNHFGATWEGATRLLHANPAMANPFRHYRLRDGDRLFVQSGTGVNPGVYRIEEIVDDSTLRLAESITSGNDPVNLSTGDIFAIMSGSVENIIVYGVQASNLFDMQSWHYDYGLHRDHAFVNIAIDNVTQDSTANGIGYLGSSNFLFMNISSPRKPTFLANQMMDITFLNSFFEFLWEGTGNGLTDGIQVRSSYVNQLPHGNSQGYFDSRFGENYVDGDPIGRGDLGGVRFHLSAPTPDTAFLYSGPNSGLLEGSGVRLPGFSSQEISEGLPLRQGAFDFLD